MNKGTYEDIVDIMINTLMDAENSRDKLLWMMKNTINPIKKLSYWRSSKEFGRKAKMFRMILEGLASPNN